MAGRSDAPLCPVAAAGSAVEYLSAASSASSPNVKVRPRFMTKPSAVAQSAGSTPRRSAAAPTSIVRATAAACRRTGSNPLTEVEPAVIRLPFGHPSAFAIGFA